jgi:sugar phosphate isomerase/epimerase
MRLGMVAGLYIKDHRQLSEPETLQFALQRAREKGLSVVNGSLGDWQDPARVDQVRCWLEATEVEFEPGFAYNYCSDDPDIHARKREEFAAFVRQMCVPLKVRTIGTCAIGVHRWSSAPPLAEQLERTAQALGGLARLAAEHGIRLALENHADYRGHEIAAIVRMAGEPNLGVRLDTGNPFWVFEEPVDAARELAPYTITTHIKDLAVAPFAQWQGVPLGQGHVDFPAIVAELAKHAPDPGTLPLVMEVEGLKDGEDVEAAADASLYYLRTTFARYLA